MHARPPLNLQWKVLLIPLVGAVEAVALQVLAGFLLSKAAVMMSHTQKGDMEV
jgi:hypothetical protein